MIAVMKRFTLFNEKSNDPGRGWGRERGTGAHWARCGLALDGAKGVYHMHFFGAWGGGRRVGGGYKIKKDEMKMYFPHKNLHNGWFGFFCVWVDRKCFKKAKNTNDDFQNRKYGDEQADG